MDIFDFVVVMTVIAVSAALVTKYISLADARARIELQKRLQKSKERTSANQRGQEEQPSGPEVGEWLPALLSQFGIDPEVIFEDEMPDELKRFLPLIKGFVDKSGGVQALVQKFAGAKPEDVPAAHWGI